MTALYDATGHKTSVITWTSAATTTGKYDSSGNLVQEVVQTVTVPAGGGGAFDVKIDEPGLYPFVSHAFAAVDTGQVGLLKVGNVHGTMSH